MPTLQVMAWFIVGISLVKLAVVLVRPKLWMERVVRPIYSHGIFRWVFLALAVFGFLSLMPGLDPVQFLAMMFVISLLIVSALIPYRKELLPAFETMYRNSSGVLRRSWPIVIVWFGMMAWAVSRLLA